MQIYIFSEGIKEFSFSKIFELEFSLVEDVLLNF